MKRSASVLFFLLCCMLTTGNTHAEDTALRDRILANLSRQTQKHFHFVQEKKLAMLDKPLVTEGELSLDANRTVIWDIQKPYTLRYVLTRDTIREIDSQGERVLQIGQNPLAAALTEAMSATFNGQWQDNGKLATVIANGNTGNWQLLVTPLAAELQPLIKNITVTGNENSMTSVVIAESNGDSTTIHLQAIPQ